jgi:hypothetical protein
MYCPFVQPYFSAGPLSIGDWGMALFAASIYLSVALFRRYDKKHTRKAVVALHHQKISTQRV